MRLCRGKEGSLAGSTHRFCIISKPVAPRAPEPGSPRSPTIVELWQKHWVIVQFAKVRFANSRPATTPTIRVGQDAKASPAKEQLLETCQCSAVLAVHSVPLAKQVGACFVILYCGPPKLHRLTGPGRRSRTDCGSKLLWHCERHVLPCVHTFYQQLTRQNIHLLSGYLRLLARLPRPICIVMLRSSSIMQLQRHAQAWTSDAAWHVTRGELVASTPLTSAYASDARTAAEHRCVVRCPIPPLRSAAG